MSRLFWRTGFGGVAVATAVGALWLSVAAGARAQTTASSIAAPAPVTLWNFLGVPQGVHKVQDALANRCGRLPGLERKPALRRIADPALAEIDNAAIKKAQQIKAEEDLAPQKIKAIKYLATLGCEKCYGGIEEAMLESLKDCTESVRYETVKALASIPDKKCPLCDTDCCSEKVTAQLAKMAYERDAEHPDCWFEASARVRRAAIETLRVCCCNQTAPSDALPPTSRPTSPPPPVEGGRGTTSPAEPSAPASTEPSADRRRGYDATMAIHVAPRRSHEVVGAPHPYAEVSVLRRDVGEEGRFVAADMGQVQVAAYVEEVRESAVASRASRTSRQSASSRPVMPTPALTNAYGRRYVTWGAPHGDYGTARRPESRPAMRRGLLD